MLWLFWDCESSSLISVFLVWVDDDIEDDKVAHAVGRPLQSEQDVDEHYSISHPTMKKIRHKEQKERKKKERGDNKHMQNTEKTRLRPATSDRKEKIQQLR